MYLKFSQLIIIIDFLFCHKGKGCCMRNSPYFIPQRDT